MSSLRVVLLTLLVLLLSRASDAQTPNANPRTSARFVVLADPSVPTPAEVRFAPGAYAHLQPYDFTTDWFSKRVASWVALLQPFMGQAKFRYLEVGIYEGRSLVWVIDHVATAADSHVTGIDLELNERLKKNITLSGAADRVTLIRGFSQVKLRSLPLNAYDVIYIDGSHTADDVLEDMVLSWRLLRPGGLMILDDYAWDGAYDAHGRSLPRELVPATAVDAFILTYQNFLDVVHKGYQVAIQKRAGTCPKGKWHCSRIADYHYDWRERALSKGGEPVALEGPERKILEMILNARVGDGRTFRLDSRIYRAKAFRVLDARLGLGLAAARRAARPQEK